MQIRGYRLEKVLGQGGMGRVYLAWHESLGRRVAIKVLMPELAAHSGTLARFEREVRVLASLNHSHVVRILEVGRAGPTFYFSMEYCEGGTLRNRLANLRAKGELMPARQVVDIALAILNGLETVHALNIVHRDIKPSNILFAEDDRPVLGDFGVVALEGAQRLTITNQSVGTPLYMAPEARDGGEATLRSDLYQVARILYDGLSGCDPVQTAPLWLGLNTDQPPPDLRTMNSEISDELVNLVNRALSLDPNARPVSAAAFSEELGGLPLKRPPRSTRMRAPGESRGAGPASGRPGSRASLRGKSSAARTHGRGRRRNETRDLWPVLVTTVVALILGAGTGIFVFSGAPPPPPEVRPTAVAITTPPVCEDVGLEFPGPELTLVSIPPAPLSVQEPGSSVHLEAPVASRHRVSLAQLGPGLHALELRLGQGANTTTLRLTVPVPFTDAPSHGNIGMVIRECFDYAKHTTDASLMGTPLLKQLVESGPRSLVLLADPEVNDPGLETLIRSIRKLGLDVTLSLYVNRYPVNPERYLKGVEHLVELIAGCQQSRVYLSLGVMLDTFGWSEALPQYRDLLALTRHVKAPPGVQLRTLNGFLYRPGTKAIEEILSTGAASHLDGLLLSWHSTLRHGAGGNFDGEPFRALMQKGGAGDLELFFDVQDPTESADTSVLDSDLMAPVMADPQFRDAATNFDQRSKRETLQVRTIEQETELIGARMRETATVLAGGATAAVWDCVLTREKGGAYRLRTHPAGIRLLNDFFSAAGGPFRTLPPAEQRQALGVKGNNVAGIYCPEARIHRFLLWSEDAPRATARLTAHQPVLVTPLLQSSRSVFRSRLVQPVHDEVEILLGWAPVLIDMVD